MPMQPRPSAETSSPWLPSLRLFMELLLVDGDLVIDEREVALALGEPGQHGGPVLPEERQPFGLVAVAGPHELGVTPDLPDRHAGRPQALKGPDPRQVVLAVPAVPGVGAVDVIDQPGAL